MIHKNDDDDSISFEEGLRHNEEMERREDSQGKSNRGKKTAETENKKARKIINYLSVEEDAWKILVAGANKAGISFTAFCSNLLTDDAEHLDEINNSRSFKLNSLRNRAKNYFDHMNAVEMIAIENSLRPSGDLAEILIKMCDELGIDPEELKQKVKNDPMAEEIASFRADTATKTAKCRQWMIELMRQNKYSYPATKGNQLGIEKGFSKDMMAQVRRKLGIQSSMGEDGIHNWVLSKSILGARTILGGEDDEWSRDA